MKKYGLLVAILGFSLFPVIGLSAQAGFTVGFNVDFPNYQTTYIGPSFSYTPTISKDLELNIGATIGIHRNDTEVQFVVPVKVGFNFLFPESTGFVPYMGVGIMPNFAFTSTQSLQFLMGPYITGGFRVRLLPLLSYFMELDETLLIGPPSWINTSTRITAGLAFRLAQ